MLLLTLLAAAWWPYPLARARVLCRYRDLLNDSIFSTRKTSQGVKLHFASPIPRLISHPCDRSIALYLGTSVFLSVNSFRSKLFPLTIPDTYEDSTAAVTKAHFTRTALVLVVNFHVYVYEYVNDFWYQSQGIRHAVTHISGSDCCYSSHPVCQDVSNTLFAYFYGEAVSETTFYISLNGGYHFKPYYYRRQEELTGTVGGLFSFSSLSDVGLLLTHGTKAIFGYAYHPLNRSFGLPFDYSNAPDILIPPGLKGVLIFWSNRSLLISQNTGQLVMPVYLKKKYRGPAKTISELKLTIHSIATNENEIAILTEQNHFYYGFHGILSSTLVKFSDPDSFNPLSALTFTDVGRLEILLPLQDRRSSVFTFQKCLINMETAVMDPQLEIDLCKVEHLGGEFANQMFIMDMNSRLDLTATLLMRPLTNPMPLVLVSNPHSLGQETKMYGDSYLLDRSTKVKLHISLKQQQHTGRTDPNYTSWIKRDTISTITLDIADKEISCVNIKPLTTFISIGCDMEKRIVVQKDITSCSQGILDPDDLQNNFTYILEGDTYKPNERKEDLRVKYFYLWLGCPLLVYFGTPWKPVLQLWKGEEFQEIISAEYVLSEVYGVFTFSYSLTARTAGCIAQPQNWSSLSESGIKRWDRTNYQSCHDPNNPNPLKWPDVPYEIMGGRTDNKVFFDRRNGIYVFSLSIVDPYYSYCQLETVFSVHVYGAVPPSGDALDIPIIVLMFTLLSSFWVAYVITKISFRRLGRKLLRKVRARLWPRRRTQPPGSRTVVPQ